MKAILFFNACVEEKELSVTCELIIPDILKLILLKHNYSCIKLCLWQKLQLRYKGQFKVWLFFFFFFVGIWFFWLFCGLCLFYERKRQKTYQKCPFPDTTAATARTVTGGALLTNTFPVQTRPQGPFQTVLCKWGVKTIMTAEKQRPFLEGEGICKLSGDSPRVWGSLSSSVGLWIKDQAGNISVWKTQLGSTARATLMALLGGAQTPSELRWCMGASGRFGNNVWPVSPT